MSKKLNLAFKQLRKAGYFARQNFLCCQSCACAAIPDDVEKYVFYHAQDNDDKKEGLPFFVAWRGVGKEIVSIFESNGINVNWDGDEGIRIELYNYN